MNTLIAVGTGAAFVYSIVATVAPGIFTSAGLPADVYYEAVIIIIALILVGNALEYTTPFGTLGGDPARAILLKRHYALRVRDAMSSLVLTRMTDLLAQLVFISAGFALILSADILPLPYRVAAGSGLVLLSLGAFFFLLAQQRHLLGRIRGWLERGWLRKRQLSEKVLTALDAVTDIDERLAFFYREEKGRFCLSVGAAFVDWTSGALAAWVAVNALGHPISFGEALMIEAFLALVRSTLFFVPADVGTQEGALVLICAAVTVACGGDGGNGGPTGGAGGQSGDLVLAQAGVRAVEVGGLCRCGAVVPPRGGLGGTRDGIGLPGHD